MRSRQYVVLGATGCSTKGKTIAIYFGDGLFYLYSFVIASRRGLAAKQSQSQLITYAVCEIASSVW